MTDKNLAKILSNRKIDLLLPINFWLLKPLVEFKKEDDFKIIDKLKIETGFHNSYFSDIEFYKPISKIF